MRSFRYIRPILFSRREWLNLMLGLAAWLPAPLLLAAAREGDLKTAPPALGPFLDTLLPQDESTAATQVGTEQYVLDTARGNRNLRRLVELGCAWLDREAARAGVEKFAQLDAARQLALVTAAEKAPARSLPRVFFLETRRLAFRHYYSQPEIWNDLGYPGPPQPAGFEGHDRPPGAGA